MNNIEITPTTKINDLLTAYPQTEELLMSMSSHFAALKNPVLRRTMAKVATIAQAAKVAGLQVSDMVNELRKNVGQSPLFINADDFNINTLKPNTLPEPTFSFDARKLIDSGGNPKNQILKIIDEFSSTDCLELITPLEPLPLIELIKKRGFKTFTQHQSGGVIKTWMWSEN